MYVLQELNKIDAYSHTKGDPDEIVNIIKKRFMVLKI